jgi:hypothetical protein
MNFDMASFTKMSSYPRTKFLLKTPSQNSSTIKSYFDLTPVLFWRQNASECLLVIVSIGAQGGGRLSSPLYIVVLGTKMRKTCRILVRDDMFFTKNTKFLRLATKKKVKNMSFLKKISKTCRTWGKFSPLLVYLWSFQNASNELAMY